MPDMTPAMQFVATLLSGTSMIGGATWYLAAKIADIRLEIASRVTRAEVRLDILERVNSERAMADITFQREVRQSMTEVLKAISELKVQFAGAGIKSSGANGNSD
jgi:hypothetical protein